MPNGLPWAWATYLSALVPVLVRVSGLMVFAQVFSSDLNGVALMGVAQSRGWNVAGEAMTPKFERLNPATNIKEVFSIRGISRTAGW